MKIYGHRGARGEAPENTLAGFAHAQAAGVDGIETDIALTRDLVPVLHHDPNLPDGRLIRDLTRAELAGIPTLAEALRAVPAIDWLLEIKTFPDDPGKSRPAAAMAAAVCATLEQAGIAPARISVLAFDWAVLAQVKIRAPALQRVCLTAPKQEAARPLWWGENYDGLSTPQAVARFGAKIWSPLHKTLTTAQIDEAHRLGLAMIPWTVNEAADFARLQGSVAGVTTDFPARLIRLRGTPR